MKAVSFHLQAINNFHVALCWVQSKDDQCDFNQMALSLKRDNQIHN